MNIRKPIFGNRLTVDTQSIVRRTLSGETKVTRAATWPRFTSQAIEFRALSDSQKEQYQIFLTANAGRLMTVTDHLERQWHGVIQDNPVFTREGDKCLWKLSFIFLAQGDEL